MQLQCDAMALKQSQIETENVQVLARVNKYERQVEEIARALKENTESVNRFREGTKEQIRKSEESAQDQIVDLQNRIGRNLAQIDSIKLVYEQQTLKVNKIEEVAKNANLQSAENEKRILTLEPSKLDRTVFEDYQKELDLKI